MNNLTRNFFDANKLYLKSVIEYKAKKINIKEVEPELLKIVPNHPIRINLSSQMGS